MSALSPYLRFDFQVRQAVALALAVLVVAGCASPRPAPIEDRLPGRPAGAGQAAARASTAAEAGPASSYTVRRGDTLYQIALDNGLDYRELAAWNHIDNVNRIYVGQALRLTAPGQPPSAAHVASAGAPEAAPPTGATTLPDGVTTAPLRSVAPVVAASATPAAGQPVPATPTAGPPTTNSPAVPGAAPGAVAMIPAPGAARAGVGAGAAPAPAGTVALKTSPKAIKLPYSDQAVRELTLEATSVPAPPNAVVATVPAPGPAQPEAAMAQPQVAPAVAATAAAGDDQLNWMWPAKGKVIAQFSDTANLKGIDIAGTAGAPVYASAAGRVVYAGSGLRGYGKLIIIKHNATYLSAYAHNQDILVKEGQQVARGQKIADMGSTDANQVKLHFEIRRFGKPMDPEKFLPPG
jgi:lipoprotein NlpD